MTHPAPASGVAAGVSSMVVANLILGSSVVYWHALGHIPAITLLGYRVLVSLVTVTLAVAVLRRTGALRAAVADRRLLVTHLLAAVLICVNWLAFIWASIHGRVIEASLGYLIAPAVTIAVGMLLVREPASRLRRAALALCLLGIALLLTRSGELYWWVFVTISTSWGLYGAVKKLSPADPVTGLTLETSFLAVGVVAVAALSPYSLALQPSADTSDYVLLALCGLISVIPLWLFSLGAKAITLTVSGFVQYLNPTAQLVIAVSVYGQVPSANTFVCFALVWLSLVSLVLEAVLGERRRQPRNQQPSTELMKGTTVRDQYL
ncbi:EamA family transporter RarD [Streptomyces sp. WMMC940]|nr:EamA family transporter RarD [Streptomyces sp. WMMC940]MCZ7462332.1 EamA family transporter RarD [Streptomyces sp. WMMC940]